jgi:transcription elongation factor SPT4
LTAASNNTRIPGVLSHVNCTLARAGPLHKEQTKRQLTTLNFNINLRRHQSPNPYFTSTHPVNMSLRGLRACMVCSIVQTGTKFVSSGCPNCEDFLEMRHSADVVQDCTSAVFEGMIAMADPESSWVAKWQRLQGYAPGTYAVKVEGLVSTTSENPLVAITLLILRSFRMTTSLLQIMPVFNTNPEMEVHWKSSSANRCLLEVSRDENLRLSTAF